MASDHGWKGGTRVLTILIIGVLAALWTAWIEPRWVKVSRFQIEMEGLSAPLKAVAIGDIQANVYHWPTQRLRSVFAYLSEEESPDLMFWLGDYYNGHTGASGAFLRRHPRIRRFVEQRLNPMDEIAGAMGALKGRLGSFAVLGNHDWAWSGEETASALADCGIRVLQDDVVTIEDPENGLSLQIAGYEDLSSGREPDFDAVHSKLSPDAVQIGLTHSPDTFPNALGGPSLMLAGHTHGGQVRLPFFGAMILPLKHKEFDRGWFTDRHRRLYVTSGLGTSLPPVRLFCRPEIVVLELRPAKLDEGAET